jgi:glycerophosphoryl diester phosphodiesterase
LPRARAAVTSFALPKVIGHRGAAAYAPENTLEGIREAAHRGARWVEVDAKLTGDGVTILMHDDTLDRTTTGRGAVADASHAAIAVLDAGAWFGANWRGLGVPTLADALMLLSDLDMQANIEIKPCPGREAETARSVVDVIRRCWPSERPGPLLSSFSTISLAVVRDEARDLPRGLLVWEYMADWVSVADDLGCASIHCAERYLSREWATRIRRADYCLAAYTVNDSARAVELAAWGVQCIISDRPDAVLHAF